MADDRALVPVNPGGEALQRPCPRCGEPIDVGREELTSHRTVCRQCWMRCDVVIARSPDAGPMRTFEEIRLAPETRPPPPGLSDLPTSGLTRHTELANLNPTHQSFQGGWKSSALGLVMSVILRVFDFHEWRATAVMSAVFAALYASTSFFGHREEVYIQDRRLVRVRHAQRWYRSIESVSVDDIIDVDVVSQYERWWIEVVVRPLPGQKKPRISSIGRKLNRTALEMEWLRDYLRAGIALAREGRGELPAPGSQPALPAPKG